MAKSEVTQLRPRGRRTVRWAAVAVAAAGLCAAFPPIRIVRTGDAAATQPASSSGKLGAEQFWQERLGKSLDKAVNAETLLAEIRRDPEAARKAHAKQVGLGGSYYYFLRGTGKVVSKDANAVTLALGTDPQPAVRIEAGPIFGNAVRDGTGLLDVNDYPNSQEFNELSAALNALVESRVLPALRERATVGSSIRFAGVAEVSDESTDLRPLRLVPVAVEPPTASVEAP
jgi:predicted lipoprotein